MFSSSFFAIYLLCFKKQIQWHPRTHPIYTQLKMNPCKIIINFQKDKYCRGSWTLPYSWVNPGWVVHMRKVSIWHKGCCRQAVTSHCWRSWAPSCPASVLSYIRPVLHSSCPASALSCIRPVLHPSCPTSVLSCIHHVLHPSCPTYTLSCIRPVLHLSCPVNDLSCIQPVLHPSCTVLQIWGWMLSLHLKIFWVFFHQNRYVIIANICKIYSHWCKESKEKINFTFCQGFQQIFA